MRDAQKHNPALRTEQHSGRSYYRRAGIEEQTSRPQENTTGDDLAAVEKDPERKSDSQGEEDQREQTS